MTDPRQLMTEAAALLKNLNTLYASYSAYRAPGPAMKRLRPIINKAQSRMARRYAAVERSAE